MDKLSDDQLKEIEDYAHDLMSWKEIAVLVNMPVSKFKVHFDNQDSDLYLAYMRGKTKRKLELRRPILSMAEKGSPQAEILAVKFIKEQYLDESTE